MRLLLALTNKYTRASFRLGQPASHVAWQYYAVRARPPDPTHSPRSHSHGAHMSPLEFGWRFLSAEGKKNAVDARHGLDFADVVGCANGGGEIFWGAFFSPWPPGRRLAPPLARQFEGAFFFFLVCV
jgi:hypothetical protein